MRVTLFLLFLVIFCGCTQSKPQNVEIERELFTSFPTSDDDLGMNFYRNEFDNIHIDILHIVQPEFATAVSNTSNTYTINETIQDPFLAQLAEDTWNSLTWATTNHLPWSWKSQTLSGGDYANPAEIGLYALSWLAAYDMNESWSPDWPETESEITAVLNQLRTWQTDNNSYNNRVFYQWYWISNNPPRVDDNIGLNQLVPSIDNAWLALSLITIREYAEAHQHDNMANKASVILADMDFYLWYNSQTHRFYWGDVQNPASGSVADYYSNENRIINFVARTLGDLSADEFQLSLDALEMPSGSYEGIVVDKVSWDGSYFTYAAPALFIREMNTDYGHSTIIFATQSQIRYAQNQGYIAWGLSDCFDIDAGDYIQQGSEPAATLDPVETHSGLVSPHASALALITPLASDAITNLHTIATTYPTSYDNNYGFLDCVLAKTSDIDEGKTSVRHSGLAQEWILLSIANYQNGFIWNYFYRDPNVVQTHVEMYGRSKIFLPNIVK